MKKLLAITLFLALAAASLVAAQPAPRGWHDCCDMQFGPKGKLHRAKMKHHGMAIKGILAHGDEIGLTDEQRDKLEKMSTAFRTERVDLKAKVEKAQIKLKALMRDEAAEAEVMAVIDQLSAFKADMQKARYRHRLEVKKVLTAEQIDKLKELRKKKRQGCQMAPGPHREGKGR
ncbi:MAG: Spy/CpxP family protein refolding chaperone [Candidatus Zixiibacteriota bacterium]|nr:MAG: Spy/CpxP family protein refolding chaperone [candidate division Zixibacteria bacterium]